MTVQLNWPSEVLDQLTQEASQKGLSLDAYLLETVLQQRPMNGVRDDDAEKAVQRMEAGRSIRELRKGNILGPDLSIRDIIAEGRRF